MRVSLFAVLLAGSSAQQYFIDKYVPAAYGNYMPNREMLNHNENNMMATQLVAQPEGQAGGQSDYSQYMSGDYSKYMQQYTGGQGQGGQGQGFNAGNYMPNREMLNHNENNMMATQLVAQPKGQAGGQSDYSQYMSGDYSKYMQQYTGGQGQGGQGQGFDSYVPAAYHPSGQSGNHDELADHYRQMFAGNYMPTNREMLNHNESNMMAMQLVAQPEGQAGGQSDYSDYSKYMQQYTGGQGQGGQGQGFNYSQYMSSGSGGAGGNGDYAKYMQQYTGGQGQGGQGQGFNYSQYMSQSHTGAELASEMSAVPTVAANTSSSSELHSEAQNIAVATNLREASPAGISSWRFTLCAAAGLCLPAAFAFLKATRRAVKLGRLETPLEDPLETL